MHTTSNGGARVASFQTTGGPVQAHYVSTLMEPQPLTYTTDFTTYPPQNINTPYIIPQGPSDYPFPGNPMDNDWHGPYRWTDGSGTGTVAEKPEQPAPLTFDDIRIADSVSLNFDDISSEMYRTYHYADGSTVTYLEPIALAITKGGHRLITADGECHYILTTWQRIS